MVSLPRRREGERLVAPFEERHADERFQRLDLAADRRLGEEELRGGTRERQVPGGGLEAPQELERGQAAVRTSHASGSWKRCALFVCEVWPEQAFCMHAMHSSTGTDMQLQLHAPSLSLEAGQVVTLDDACGT